MCLGAAVKAVTAVSLSGCVIHYDDPLSRRAVREVLTLPAVSRVEVSTSIESERPAPVDLVRLLGEG